MYLIIIYSCKKNREKSNFLYNLIINRLNNCKIYILNGDKELENDYEIIDNKYLLIKCGDYYENLCQKSITLFKTIKTAFPNITGVFKCDDDIIPNITKLNELISFIENNNNINYLGNKNTLNNDHESIWHYNKCSDNKYNVPKKIKKCVHASGPLYYVSMVSINILIN